MMSMGFIDTHVLPQRILSRVVTLEDRGLVTHILEAFPAPRQDSQKPPLIVLIHGFPELAYSWRHVMIPLADLGYRVVAPDLRGCGRTTAFYSNESGSAKAPIDTVAYEDDLTPYTITSHATDIRSLILALGELKAECIMGHDFGSPTAAVFAQLYPTLLNSLICMSAPYTGIPAHLINPTETPPEAALYASIFKALAEFDPPRRHYMAYFSLAEANDDLLNAEGGLEKFLREYFYVKGANWPANDFGPLQVRPEGGPGAIAKALSTLPDYYVMRANETMPQTVDRLTGSKTPVTAGLDGEDVRYFAAEFMRTGFQGGLNNYRANVHPHTGKFTSPLITIDKSQDLSKFQVPGMYIAGKYDVGAWQVPGAIDKMKFMLTGKPGKAPIGEAVFIDSAGHWVQQENPTQLIAVITQFLEAVNGL